ncbi:MAG: hypothetical protein J7L45_03535 [Candidatus Aenigmarchaeota archaeon]|nr:hypothetical protein [Candidatus Aenigmarchaeota archaeon]
MDVVKQIIKEITGHEDKKTKIPKILNASKKYYAKNITSKDDRGLDGLEVGKIGQYNIIEFKEGPIVGGVGFGNRPPRAHPTYYWELKEAYIGIIDSVETIKRTMIKTQDEDYHIQKESMEKVEMSGFEDKYGIWIRKVDDFDKKYSVQVVEFETIEKDGRPLINFVDSEESLTTEYKRTKTKTMSKILKVLPKQQIKKLGIEIERIEKYKLPDGSEILIE